MSFRKILSLLILLVWSFLASATDTTLLIKRIHVIKKLSKELNNLPFPDFREISDTMNLLENYKNIEPTYFKPPITWPEFNIRYSLGYFHKLLNRTSIDSFPLRYPEPKIDSITQVGNLHGYLANTVILYLPMDGEEWEGLYFVFKEGTDQLIYLIEAGGEDEMYRRKKRFINQLHSATKN